ncbi:MAG: hypothetical protein NVV66_18275 [Cellulomonas sp.]|uniref:hypothetical protein n=1 Tax=Cellulomonas sp. TaxID=40001 RepID=UPI00258FDBB3|nr:hypothetical protein [Cellulomonas sp.]MCR6706544.1 hypothetical protein [Cellulomonas sp.]
MAVPRPDSVPQSTVSVDVGAGAETAEAATWSVDRDLSGGGLPGQVRAASGFAVGSGQVSMHDSQVRTAWTTSRVRPGGSVSIDAAEDTGTAYSQRPVARMVVTDLEAPSALSTERALTIADDVTSMRAPVNVPAVLLSGTAGGLDTVSTDAAWLIYLAAKAGGRHAVPPAVSSAILVAPLCGYFAAEVGATSDVSDPGLFWGTDASGRIYCRQAAGTLTLTEPFAVGETVYVTWTEGRWASHVRLETASAAATIDIGRIGSTQFQVSIFDGTSSTTQVGPWAQQASAIPGRMQFRIVRTSATSTSVSIRSSAGGAWSSAVTITHASVAGPIVQSSWFEEVSGLQVTRAADSALWSAAGATIASSGSLLQAVVGFGQTDAWSLAQAVAASTMGAVWIDETGTLIYRARDLMRGSGVSVGTITADGVTDLPWSLSMQDVADRVEVTYQPPAISLVSDYSATVWTADKAVSIPAGKTRTVYADLGTAAADQLAPFFPLWSTNFGLAPAGTYSRWAAATSASGGGVTPSDTALQVTATRLSPSRVRIDIRNTTASTLWTVDGTGTPSLILRANVSASPGEPVTIAAGATADAARNPVTVDLGPYVQDDAFAAEALAWLQSMTTAPQPVLDDVDITQVDMSIRLGDVRKLVDPSYTGIAAKVLVAGTHLSAEPGSLAQRLRLVVLLPMFNDLDRALATLGITTFDQLDTYLVAQGITTFDALDTWLLSLGGL